MIDVLFVRVEKTNLYYIYIYIYISADQARNYRILRQPSRAPKVRAIYRGFWGHPPRKFSISWSSDKLFPAFWGVLQQEINLIDSDTIIAILQSPKCNPVPIRQHDMIITVMKMCVVLYYLIHHTSNSTVLHYMYWGTWCRRIRLLSVTRSKIEWSLWSIFAWEN
jgi:hypothetical protein